MMKDEIKYYENGVIVHFLAKGKTADEKFNQLEEIRRHASDYRIKKGLDFVWYYLITKIDDELEEELTGNDCKVLSSNSGRIYYKYYEWRGMHFYVMSSPTPVADLRAKNELYVNIDKLLNGKVKQESLNVSKAA